MKQFASAFSLLALLPVSLGQFPPAPTGLDIVTSKVNSQVKISYKETNICETTKGVKSYSGYVHLPGSLLSDVGGFDINTYFIYFEARHNASTAPLAIYLAGGPGESSIYTALASESGPCYVNVAGNDTIINPWSFNNYVNMLYLDQPVQTGFSYDELVNGTFNLETQIITPEHFSASSPLPAINATFQVGTFPSQDPLHVTNTTVSSARALWHATEHWLSSFPEYSTSSNKFSIWANSYGGYWGPETAALFSKSLENLPTTHPLKGKNLTLDTLGITNGCIDMEYSMPGYPQFAYNNTYGVHFIPEAVYKEAMDNITKPKGCMDLMNTCRSLGQTGDPDFNGNNQTVNSACMAASESCSGIMSAFDALNNRSDFDVAVHTPDPCPYNLGVTKYLNLPAVQTSLGVPLNFTYDSELVTGVYGFPTPYPFLGTGDTFRQAGMPNIEYALARGVKVAFVFGDRDYRCPWTGAETTAKAARWAHQTDFVGVAGYEPLQGTTSNSSSSSKDGPQALVKQYGALSFSRVLNAGHAVSAYAPEVVYRVFERVMFGKDVATGSTAVNSTYHTTGPLDSWAWRNTLPADVPHTCMVEGEWTAKNPWGDISLS
ncbi:uncharacterized protein Z520_03707 [Fonsecaea multimorphosa CBS 102226]|uniref:Carboxypeptidase n=1 Tax=Fonsecaea multimorphosa CBS 102226 TaxID=1442371 RepID=A0A0D2HGL2_9EURO|nr:uncharacterized protein Z520_03707 [Fonsecaea multimorphosa CBS 102226]KIY01041.1 hypothetical protein Z520_03707 [Fonsecaea multimorphosa CBS 102226]OAL27625.1 hypothetical protein AYO22_03529 [Fonsecaea multimorphosa]